MTRAAAKLHRWTFAPVGRGSSPGRGGVTDVFQDGRDNVNAVFLILATWSG